jgi:hypothetical protein
MNASHTIVEKIWNQTGNLNFIREREVKSLFLKIDNWIHDKSFQYLPHLSHTFPADYKCCKLFRTSLQISLHGLLPMVNNTMIDIDQIL